VLNCGEPTPLGAFLDLRIRRCEQFHGVHYTYLSEKCSRNFRKLSIDVSRCGIGTYGCGAAAPTDLNPYEQRT